MPVPTRTTPGAGVQTLSYQAQKITYVADLSQPTLLVENELAINGWRSDDPRVQPAKAGIPLRAWRLPAGQYQFSASYHEPGRALQGLALAAALAAWLGCAFALRRYRPRPTPRR